MSLCVQIFEFILVHDDDDIYSLEKENYSHITHMCTMYVHPLHICGVYVLCCHSTALAYLEDCGEVYMGGRGYVNFPCVVWDTLL